MKNRPYLKYLLIFAGAVVALGIVLYFVTPWAPLALAASLVIQLPIIVILTRTNLTAGYRDRAFARRARFAEDGDAAAWLAEEQREAVSQGYRFWSRAGRAQSALNRADALAELGRGNEAAALLAEIEEKTLPAADRQRYQTIVERIQVE